MPHFALNTSAVAANALLHGSIALDIVIGISSATARKIQGN
jgi:hypothetical protein